MHKNLLRYVVLCVSFVCLDIRAVQDQGYDSDSSNHSSGEIDQELMALAERVQDPDRYGDIIINQLSYEDRDGSKKLLTRVSGGYDLGYRKSYPRNRVKMAKAALCNEYSEKFMEIALKRQDRPLLKIFLEQGFDPQSGRFGYPIMEAKTIAVAELLMKYGASMQVKDSMWGTVLHRACHDDFDVNLLKHYIRYAGVDINSRDNFLQETPLQLWARISVLCCFGDFDNCLRAAQDKLDVLLEAGAVLSYKNINGETALDILIERKKKEQDYIERSALPEDRAKVEYRRSYLTCYEALISKLSAAKLSAAINAGLFAR